MSVRVEVDSYRVSLFPTDSFDGELFDITVEARGHGKWAICRGRLCMSRDGAWSFEAIPSARDDEWLREHRFEHDEALQIAVRVAPHVERNGRTAAEAAAS